MPKVGDRVSVEGYSELYEATVRYLGNTSLGPGNWVGVEFRVPIGDSDGSENGQRHFTTLQNHGLFVRPNTVHMSPVVRKKKKKKKPSGKKKSRKRTHFNATHSTHSDIITIDDDDDPLESPQRKRRAEDTSNDEALARFLQEQDVQTTEADNVLAIAVAGSSMPSGDAVLAAMLQNELNETEGASRVFTTGYENPFLDSHFRRTSSTPQSRRRADAPRRRSSDANGTTVLPGRRIRRRGRPGGSGSYIPPNMGRFNEDELDIDSMDYNALLDLGDRLGPAGPPKDVAESFMLLSSLPSTAVKSVATDPEMRACSICLMDYEIGEMQKTLSCFHRFHDDCITEWFKQKTTCPVCKTPQDAD